MKQFQCPAHFVGGEQIEEGRLLEFNKQRCVQGIVEDRVTGLIAEIGENHGVIGGKPEGVADAPVDPASRSHRKYQHGRGDPLPEVAHQAPLLTPQRLQIRAHIGRGLVPLVAFLLQRLGDDGFQPGRNRRV